MRAFLYSPLLLMLCGSFAVCADLKPDLDYIREKACLALKEKNPKLPISDLELMDIYYERETGTAVTRQREFCTADFRLISSLERYENSEEVLVYFDTVSVWIDMKKNTIKASGISHFVEHNVRGSGGYNGRAHKEPLWLSPRDLDDGGCPSNLANLSSHPTTQELLQAYCDLLGIKIRIERHIYRENKIRLFYDRPPTSTEEALQILTVVLGGSALRVDPIDENSYRARRVTYNPSKKK